VSYFTVVDRFPLAAAGSAGAGGDGGKVGLPALDVALAFPQATPASLFPPAGEISNLLLMLHPLSRLLCTTTSSLAIFVRTGEARIVRSNQDDCGSGESIVMA